eukprot:TRINITY_DN6734_c0_g1_i6.p1 TRINITY_DN6734_c0_g1~~TRINITY_DN6734_c0_g1_i6.p1  ORF type:complete len:469 (+),score=88.97 TRINITY_DN6734_c0_g1_i6:147-1553(+)
MLRSLVGSEMCIRDRLSVGSGATVSGTGRMSFHHNSVVGGGGSGEGSMMDFTAGTLGPVTPPMRTCRNYIDGQLCTLSAGDVYACANGYSRLAGNIADCTYTDTTTVSTTWARTLSTSIHTLSVTPPHTHSPSTTNTHRSTASPSYTPHTPSLSLSSTDVITPTPYTGTSTVSYLPTASHTETRRTSSTTHSVNTTPTLTRTSSTTMTATRAVTSTISQSQSLYSPSTSTSVSVPHTSSRSRSIGTHSGSSTATSSHTATLSLSTTTSATYSVSSTIPLPINETCNYTCADTVALQQVTPTTTTTPQQAIDAYLGNISTSTTTGCTAMALPFTATAQGAVTTVLMHLAASKLPLNQSNLLVGMVLSTTKPGAMQASIVAANYTADGGLVVVFDVRRVDASPTNIVSGSVVLPGGNSGPFFCTPTSTLPQSGLPWANIALGAPPPALSEGERTAAVSYTHLTLPTKRIV